MIFFETRPGLTKKNMFPKKSSEHFGPQIFFFSFVTKVFLGAILLGHVLGNFCVNFFLSGLGETNLFFPNEIPRH